MSSASPPAGATKVPPLLLDLVLAAGSRLSQRANAPEIFEGQPGVSRTVGLTVGYLECASDLGMADLEYNSFVGWLQETGRTLPGQGWWSAFLQEFGPDERLILRAFVDATAEFRAQPSASLASLTWKYGGAPPPQTDQRHPSETSRAILDVLLEIQRLGRVLLYIGEATVERLAGYIDGYRLCHSLAGLKDEEYSRFERWLQDNGHSSQRRTWEGPFLEAAQGNHEVAIHQFLNCVAEFHRRAGRAVSG